MFLDDAAGHTNCYHRVLVRQTHANVTYESKVTVSIDPSSPGMFIFPYRRSQCAKVEEGKRIQEGASRERIRVNNSQIRGRGNCPTLQKNDMKPCIGTKYCHYYLNFIKLRNLSSACLHESQERCVASSRN